MTNQKKIQKVEKICQILQNSQNFVLINFGNISHQKLENLRRELKKNQSRLSVIKNTLLEKAIDKLSTSNKLLTELKNKFFPQKGPSALITFSSDWNTSLSAFYRFSQNEKTLTFKFGLLDNQIYNEEEMKRIAQLPTKEELLAKIINSMKAPLIRLNYGLKYNMMKLVYIFQQKSKQN